MEAPTTGIYWLNRNVPEDVRPFVGKTRWKRTLETRSYSEAERRIIPHLAETNQIVEDVRAGRLRSYTDEQLTALVQRWFPPLLEITTAGPGQVQDEGPPMTDQQVEQALRDRLEGEGVGIAPGSPDYLRLLELALSERRQLIYTNPQRVPKRSGDQASLSQVLDRYLGRRA